MQQLRDKFTATYEGRTKLEKIGEIVNCLEQLRQDVHFNSEGLCRAALQGDIEELKMSTSLLSDKVKSSMLFAYYYYNRSVTRMVYEMLRSDAEKNVNYNKKNWAYHVKYILGSHGLRYIWLDQDFIDINLDLIRQRILDNFKQTWFSNINMSARLSTYCIFKQNFEFEKYLDVHMDRKYKIALCRFRISAHSLNIETGRRQNIPRENRLCKNCRMSVLENEYHFLLAKFRDLRMKFFKPYYCHWPNYFELENLMSTQNKNLIINLAKYIYQDSKIRIS